MRTRSDDQAHHLQRGDAEHAEHQVAHHLVCAAHLHAAPTVVVLDGSVDPLGGAAFIVAEVFGEAVSDQTLAPSLLGQFLLQPGGGTRIEVDDRHMPKIAAALADRSVVVGGIHQVVEVGDPCRGHGGQWDGDLAVMHGSGGEHAVEGDVAIGAVDVELVADPGFAVPLGIALGADIAVPRQVGQHLRQGHAQLAFDPARRLGGGGRILSRPARLGGGGRNRGGGATGAGGGSGLAGFSRASIAVLSRETWPTKRSVWVCWISASCSREGKALSANSAKAREKVASLGTSLARCQPHSCRNVLSLASRVISRRVVGKLNTALATKARARAARSTGGRPTRTGQEGSNASIRIKPSTATNCLWRGVSGPSGASSSQGRSAACR